MHNKLHYLNSLEAFVDQLEQIGKLTPRSYHA